MNGGRVSQEPQSGMEVENRGGLGARPTSREKGRRKDTGCSIQLKRMLQTKRKKQKVTLPMNEPRGAEK